MKIINLLFIMNYPGVNSGVSKSPPLLKMEYGFVQEVLQQITNQSKYQVSSPSLFKRGPG